MVDQYQNTPTFTALIGNWPNLISLTRLLAVPFIIWLILSDQMTLALIACILAGISDMLDGYLARILESPSKLGALLDPLADKILLVSLYLTLGFKGDIPYWLMLLVVLRDVLITAGFLSLSILQKPFNGSPIVISKLNTFLQILAVVWVLLQTLMDAYFVMLTNSIFIMVAITTTISWVAYAIMWVRSLFELEK